MSAIKVCLAIRDKTFEDQIIQQIEKAGFSHSSISTDDIENGTRSEDLVFIVEDSYHSILDIIEFHNSCHINFIPVIFLTDPKSQYKDWIKKVRFSYKYMAVESKIFPIMVKRTIKMMNELKSAKMHEFFACVNNRINSLFSDRKLVFSQAIQTSLRLILDFLFAERGSIMLLNENGNLVIEAATKKSLVGLEIPYNNSSVAWTVVDTKEPLFVEDIGKDERFKKKEQNYSKDYFLSIPIFIKGEIRGVFNMSDKMVALLFNKTDLKWAQKFINSLESLFAHYYLDKKYRILKAEQDKIINMRDSSIFMLIHDLKLPLSSIKGNLEIIRMSHPSENPDTQFIDTAIAASEDINLMVNSILDIYKMKIGRLTPHYESTNLNMLVSSIVDSFSAYARLVNVNLTFSFNEENIEFITDHSILSRILGNLVLNALKHIDKKEDALVEVMLHNSETINIEVKDNGSGIPSDSLNDIFEPFFTTNGDKNSHGLGLSFVKSATDLIGGRISVNSIPGATSFKLTFLKQAEKE